MKVISEKEKNVLTLKTSEYFMKFHMQLIPFNQKFMSNCNLLN